MSFGLADEIAAGGDALFNPVFGTGNDGDSRFRNATTPTLKRERATDKADSQRSVRLPIWVAKLAVLYRRRRGISQKRTVNDVECYSTRAPNWQMSQKHPLPKQQSWEPDKGFGSGEEWLC
jgi:hypothetical protein